MMIFSLGKNMQRNTKACQKGVSKFYAYLNALHAPHTRETLGGKGSIAQIKKIETLSAKGSIA